MKTKGFRLWGAQQKNGIVVDGKWKGSQPLLTLGVWVRSGDVEEGLKVSEVAKVIKDALQSHFPSIGWEEAPKGTACLAGKHDGLGSFPQA